MKNLIILVIMSFSLFAHTEEVDPEAPVGLPVDEAQFDDDDKNPPDNNDSEIPEGVVMETPFHHGPGCPRDLAIGAVLSPDAKTLSVLFDNFQVEAGAPPLLQQDHKACALRIPITVPPGYRMTVVKIDYRGYNLIPNNGRTRFVTTYHFSHGRSREPFGESIKRIREFVGPKDREFFISSKIRKVGHFSNCGKPFNFHLRAKLAAISNRKLENVLTVLDSADAMVREQSTFHLKWKRCHPQRPSETHPPSPRGPHR